MHREVLLDCAPYVAGIIVLVLCQALLLRFSRAKLHLAQIWHLHRDQRGAVQSLSFILTLPVFLFIMMFIVQLSLITMARISVEYAAYAAARSAIVWLPANLDVSPEGLNENIVSYGPLLPTRSYEARGRTYYVYPIPPDTVKYERIRLAAAMACMPISPSTRTSVPTGDPLEAALPSIQSAYEILAPDSISNSRIPARLRNKLQYALGATRIEIEVHHCGDEIQGGDPPLYPELYLRYNEIGWQDQIYVTVYHDYALLPGPGRLLARRADSATVTDTVASQIRSGFGVYTRSLSATVRMGNEGQKPSPTIPTSVPQVRRTYVQPLPWSY